MTLFCNGTACGTATVGPDGHFEIASTKISSGTYPLAVSQSGSNGVFSSPLAAGTATILGPPTVTSCGLTPTGTGQFRGTAAPGAIVKIYDTSGAVYATETAAADGTFTIIGSLALPGGTNTFTATQANSAGTSNEAPAGSLTVAALVVTSTTVKGGNTAQLNGTGTPGSQVKIYDQGAVVGTATVGPDGKWYATSSILSPGSHTFTATQTPAGSTESSPIPAGSVNIASIIVTNTTVIAGNKVQVQGYGIAGSTVKLYENGVLVGSGLVGQNGLWFTIATFAHSSTSRDGNTAIVNGTGTTGSQIKIYDGSTVVGTAIVGSDGKWSATTSALSPGAHTLTATQTLSGGTESASISAGSVTVPSFVVTSTGLGAGGNVAVVNGTGTAGSTIKIYESATVVGTALVGSDGKWSATSSVLSPGSHTFTATQTPAGGAESSPISAGSVTVQQQMTTTMVKTTTQTTRTASTTSFTSSSESQTTSSFTETSSSWTETTSSSSETQTLTSSTSETATSTSETETSSTLTSTSETSTSLTLTSTTSVTLVPSATVITTTGTFTWTAPPLVYTVQVVCIGGGGGCFNDTVNSYGGGGAGLVYHNTLAVTPGQTYNGVVGAGGTKNNAGGDSSFTANTITITAEGGQASYGGRGSGSGTGAVAQSGGFGGRTMISVVGGGGGCAGYTGSGGNGAKIADSSFVAALAGTGGGGGGGDQAHGGGGVGLYGVGTNGAAGTGGSGGGGGSSGSSGTTDGGAYGGGAGENPTCIGGNGACRIMWGGGRSFPSNAPAP